MLGATVVLVAVLTLTAATLLGGIASAARAGIHAAAEHAVAGAVDDALAAYRGALAARIAADPAALALGGATPFTGTPAPVALLASAVAPPPALIVASTPAPSDVPGFAVVATVTPTTLAPPRCPASGAAASGKDAIGWLQCDGYVQESRLSLRVVVAVRDASGTLLVRREEDVALRLFAQPPYSAPVGRLDPAGRDPVAAGATLPHEGDAGGDTVSGASPPQPSPYPAGGSLLHVAYACSAGSVDCALAAPPDPDAHLVPGAAWSDGNALAQ